MPTCKPGADDQFGPRVVGCRNNFDFTLLFEQAILSIPISVMVMVVCVHHISKLLKVSVKVKAASSCYNKPIIKQIPLAAFTTTQFALVVLWSSPSRNPTSISAAASAVSMASGFLLAILSYIHHSRAIRPSGILNTYLAFSTLFDTAQARTLWLRHNYDLATVFTIGLAFKALSLSAEMREKQRILREPYSSYPPEALGGVMNRSVFWWINSLLLKGSSSSLQLDDLFELDKELSFDYLQQKFKHSWCSSMNTNPSPKVLMKTVFRCFWKQISYIIFFRLCLIAFKFCQPLLIHRAISLLMEPEDSPSRKSIGYALIGATLLIYIGIAVTTGFFRHNVYRLITMLRGSLIGLIYETTLHIDALTAKDGAAITLMSTDIDCMATGMEEFDAVWASPFEIAIAIYLLYNQVGLAVMAPIAIATVFVLISIAIRKISTSAQKSWLEATQRRVAITSIALSNIKPIKMMGLSDTVGKRLQSLRVEEIKTAGKFRAVLSGSLLISTSSVVLIPFFTLATYVLMMRATDNIQLDSVVAFTTLALVTLLANPIRQFVKGVPKVAAAIGCFQRIQKYLLSSREILEIASSNASGHDSHDSKAELQFLGPSMETRVDGVPLLTIENADFILQSGITPILRNISLSITSGTWTVLAGPIGCGKSLLLFAIINELRHLKGSVFRSPSLEMGYCSQDPWLPNLSIKELIVAHSAWNEELYSTVLDVCLLRRDLSQFPQGDQQVIGSKGLSLSGGQKQRLSLARALYSRKQLLILDDILGGLDPKTEQGIVNNVFGNGGFLRKYSMTALLATHSIRHARRADHVIIMAPGGSIVEQGPPSKISIIKKFAEDTLISPEDITQQNSFVMEEAIEDQVQHESPQEPADDDLHEELSRRTGDFRLYLYYFRAIGWATTIAVLVSVMSMAIFIKIRSLWVQWWSESEQINPGKETNMYIGVFGLICALALISVLFGVISLLQYAAPHTSNGLHQKLLDTVIRAPYWFLVSTDTGNLVNRFSQDMSLICLQLPFALEDTMLNFSFCVVGVILITLASKWSMVIYPALIFILYFLQKFYLRTSRQLRLLDLEAKSPLYSDFIQTLQGVVTIRAFGWQRASTTKSAMLLDKSQRPFYLMYSIQRWLNLVLDLLVAGVAMMIVALATQLKDSSAGALGVSLLNILSFSQDLVDLIQTWTDLETSLGAISRIRAFEKDSPSERLPGERSEPPAQWPSQGLIRIDNLSTSYKPDSEPILKDMCLQIEPGSKVGVCGRTGSGKSTFLLSLLRLAEIQSGDILIDGISLKTTPRNVVRRRIMTMPQEALFLPGTVRSNADPLFEHSDEEILAALLEVGILDIITGRGGLDADMETLALSHGQQQLFCLTRVILSRSKIVLLDEITSSVDAVTEAKMMEVVERTFRDRTVVAIAHHLHTIRNFDKIIVLDQGCVVEVGSPEELLQNPLSVFRELWERNR